MANPTKIQGLTVELISGGPVPSTPPSPTAIVVTSVASDPRPGQGAQLSTAGIAALLNSAASYYNATNVGIIRNFGSQNGPEIVCTPFSFRMSVAPADAITQYNAIVTALQTAANIN